MSYDVVITEKPEVAKAVKEAFELQGKTFRFHRGDNGGSYYYNDGLYIIPCYGHMLKMADPDYYDGNYKFWTIKDLPIFPDQFVMLPDNSTPTKTEQLEFLKKFMKGAQTIYHAGDTDDEGQLIVDELIDYFGCQQPVLRLLINDNNPNKILEQINNPTDNAKCRYMSARAHYRSVLDWLVGMNITRLMTKAYAGPLNAKVLSAGRVQSAILGIVIGRDKAFENHVQADYYKIPTTFHFEVDGERLDFCRPVIEDASRHMVDEKGRFNALLQTQTIADELVGNPIRVVSKDVEVRKKAVPLPFNLAKIQQTALRRFKGLSLDSLMTILQDLKDKHKLITYHRTACQYLNDEAHASAPAVMQALANGIPELERLVADADLSLKSRAFNTSKVSEHHGICPTEKVPDLGSLSEMERNIYLMVARSYLAQFYPAGEDEVITVVFESCGERFKASHTHVQDPGWRIIFGADADDEDEEGGDTVGDEGVDGLHLLRVDMQGRITHAEVVTHKTKPLPRFTTPALIGAITSNISRYISSPDLRSYWEDLEREAKKEGASSNGLGTEATIPEIMSKLISRGFLMEEGGKLISTSLGRAYFDKLDYRLGSADLTASNAITQSKIHSKDQVRGHAVELVEQVIRPIIDGVKTVIDYNPASEERKPEDLSNNPKCPECSRPLRRIAKKDGSGHFWSCTGFREQPQCKYSCNDKDGKPYTPPPRTGEPYADPCAKCGGEQQLFRGETNGRAWQRVVCTKCKNSFFLNSNTNNAQTQS